MRRDMDLVRRILLAVEEIPPHGSMTAAEFEAKVEGDPAEISGLVFKLWEGGWLKIVDLSDNNGPDYWIQDLTLEGADFLDAVRSEGAMAKVREAAAQVGTFPLELAKAVATQWVKAKLNLTE